MQITCGSPATETRKMIKPIQSLYKISTCDTVFFAENSLSSNFAISSISSLNINCIESKIVYLWSLRCHP